MGGSHGANHASDYGHASGGGAPSRGPFAHSSLALLQTITDSALDPGYREAARAKPTRHPISVRIGVVLLALLLGAGSAIAARNLRAANEVEESVRTDLAAQVETRQDRIAEMDEGNVLLVDQIAALERSIPDDTPAAGQFVVGSATRPAAGPGVIVTLQEPSTGDRSATAVLTDQDLREAVNLLWSAGAEAIAVNGIRVGPATTIRTAGSAILVDLTAVEAPYSISAIGDAAALSTAVRDSEAGQNLQADLNRRAGSLSSRTSDSVELPPATAPTPKHAHQLTRGSGQSGAKAPTEDAG